MSKCLIRSFSREFKLKAVERMRRGEVISALSAELGVRRQLLYKWREAFRSVGDLGPRGRPRRAEASARQAAAGESELEAGRRKIAELERKIGQQQLEIDFFQQALRRIEASRRPSDGSGATASSAKSRR
jgi:transposase-like protein